MFVNLKSILVLLLVPFTYGYDSLLEIALNQDLDNQLTPFAFLGFNSIKESKYKKFQFGFPAGIWGSSIIPISLWFMHWEEHGLKGMVPNFGNLIPLTVDWFRLTKLCDEILVPRCSWPYFLTLLQPLNMESFILEKMFFPEILEEFYIIPYVNGDCYPLRTREQMSIIYIYSVCTVYWDVPGFDRNLCPNPCARSPCKLKSFARSGSCIQLGLHEMDFDCLCLEGFFWHRPTFSCITESRCDRLCHPNNTESCKIDPNSATLTCVCRRGYMGHDCANELDACLVGSAEYDQSATANDEISGPILPSGLEACSVTLSTENKCLPQLGSTSYSCVCGSMFTMDQSLPYDNCRSRKDPCASRICINGYCVSSQNGQTSICDCEDGYTGDLCDVRTGSWSGWSAWTPCEPYCGSQRQRRRVRVCLGYREDDCIGAVENVEFCSPTDKCPAVITMEEFEWQSFANWTGILLVCTLGYIGLLLICLTIFTLCKPQERSTKDSKCLSEEDTKVQRLLQESLSFPMLSKIRDTYLKAFYRKDTYLPPGKSNSSSDEDILMPNEIINVELHPMDDKYPF